MRTALTYTTLVHDHDAVSMLDSGQTVRNHDCCPAVHELFKRLLYENFCLCIYVGGCLVHDNDITDEQVKEAAEYVNASHFIEYKHILLHLTDCTAKLLFAKLSDIDAAGCVYIRGGCGVQYSIK